jgi:hypothetical protein
MPQMVKIISSVKKITVLKTFAFTRPLELFFAVIFNKTVFGLNNAKDWWIQLVGKKMNPKNKQSG